MAKNVYNYFWIKLRSAGPLYNADRAPTVSWICAWYTHTHSYTRALTRTHSRSYTHKHTHSCSHSYSHTYTHSHTNSQIYSPSWSPTQNESQAESGRARERAGSTDNTSGLERETRHNVGQRERTAAMRASEWVRTTRMNQLPLLLFALCHCGCCCCCCCCLFLFLVLSSWLAKMSYAQTHVVASHRSCWVLSKAKRVNVLTQIQRQLQWACMRNLCGTRFHE